MSYFDGEAWEILKSIFRSETNSLVANDLASDRVDRGYGWIINYSFELAAAGTAYLLFKAGDVHIHATGRTISIVDLATATINVEVTTLANPTVNVLGADISGKVINANLNLTNSIQLDMWDETTTLTSEGDRLPFSGTITSDKKQATRLFISNEYVLPKTGYIALKFVNNGGGNVKIEYNSTGYQHD